MKVPQRFIASDLVSRRVLLGGGVTFRRGVGLVGGLLVIWGRPSKGIVEPGSLKVTLLLGS
jgi:hypothetical protein